MRNNKIKIGEERRRKIKSMKKTRREKKKEIN